MRLCTWSTANGAARITSAWIDASHRSGISTSGSEVVLRRVRIEHAAEAGIAIGEDATGGFALLVEDVT
ncbi:MAG: hypothetical protein AABZ01_05215, partial [Gemmatimonadota bacterium]